MWNISSFSSTAVLILSFIIAFYFLKNDDSKKSVKPISVLLIGTFLSGVLLFMPHYFNSPATVLSVIEAILVSVHDSVQLFILGNNYNIVTDALGQMQGLGLNIYRITGAILFILAPILTTGFVLIMFESVSSYIKYCRYYFSDEYVFSCLNARSVALAESIRHKDQKALLIFADSSKNVSNELKTSVQSLKAIYFRKELSSLNLNFHSTKKDLLFFLLNNDESENLDLALKVADKYADRDKTHIYVMSSETEGELLLSSVNNNKVKLRRINEVRSLINHFLYYEGHRLFKTALPDKDGKKKINVVIVGLGNYGTEMLKALAWYGQMDGYEIRIDAFDKDESAEDKFAMLCPELTDPAINGKIIEGESRYTIKIHSGIDVETKQFFDELKTLPKTTYALVALGSEDLNIQNSVNLRVLFERLGSKPILQSIVSDPQKNTSLKNLRNSHDQDYNIEFIGNLKTSFSADVIMNSELERDALSRHLKWGDEDSFWKYEYNYRSSVASAIHRKARIACKIPGADKSEVDLTQQESNVLETLEHQRWNAYMRSEGYVYSGNPDKSSRNDLGKMHHNLLPFSALTEEDKIKDIKIASK